MRAVHSLNDADPLFNDAFARQLLTREERIALFKRLASGFDQQELKAAIQGKKADEALAYVVRGNPAYGNVILRTRYIDDRFGQALTRGCAQFVVLGAGMDSSCFRQPYQSSGIRIFEVDHPATQESKRSRITSARLEVPGNVAYVGADFEHVSLDTALAESGFDKRSKALFTSMGVSPYLTKQANLGLLGSISACAAAGSELVITYVAARTAESAAAAKRKPVLRFRPDEAILSRFEPGEFESYLGRCGFDVIEQLGAAELWERYCSDRLDDLRPMESFRVVLARLGAAS